MYNDSQLNFKEQTKHLVLEIENLQEESKNLKVIAKLQAKIDKMEAEYKAVSMLLGEEGDILTNALSLQNQLSSYKNQVDVLSAQNQNLLLDIEDKQATETKLNESINKIDQLVPFCRSLEKQNIKLTTQAEQIMSEKIEVEHKLKEALIDKLKTLDNEANSIEDFIETKIQNDNLMTNYSALSTENEQLTLRIEEYTDMLETSLTKIGMLEEDKSVLRQNMKSLEEVKSTLTHKLKELEQQNHHLLEASNLIANNYETLTIQHKKLVEKHRKTKDRLDAFRGSKLGRVTMFYWRILNKWSGRRTNS